MEYRTERSEGGYAAKAVDGQRSLQSCAVLGAAQLSVERVLSCGSPQDCLSGERLSLASYSYLRDLFCFLLVVVVILNLPGFWLLLRFAALCLGILQR